MSMGCPAAQRGRPVFSTALKFSHTAGAGRAETGSAQPGIQVAKR
jgi:hypothetical protein